MVVANCKACGTKVKKPYREWDCTPKAKEGEIHVFIHCFQCPKCGQKFRTATRDWPKKGLLGR